MLGVNCFSPKALIQKRNRFDPSEKIPAANGERPDAILDARGKFLCARGGGLHGCLFYRLVAVA